MLRKHGNARKFPARVVAVGHECDIALLTVDAEEVGGARHDTARRPCRCSSCYAQARVQPTSPLVLPSPVRLFLQFWDDQVEALEVGPLPHMQDSVTVVGFPQVRCCREGNM